MLEDELLSAHSLFHDVAGTGVALGVVLTDATLATGEVDVEFPKFNPFNDWLNELTGDGLFTTLGWLFWGCG